MQDPAANAAPVQWRQLVVDPALQLPGWGAAHKRTRISFDKGGIRVNFPAHPHASAGGTNWGFKPPGLFPAREARVSCDVYVQRDFPFEASGSSAGKWGIGIEAGTGAASGGNWSRTGASYRLMWLGADAEGADAMGYIYTEVSNPNDHRASADQGPGVLDSAVLTSGGINLWRKVEKPCRLLKGKWNHMEIYMKLNTPGKRDGVAEMTVNGVTQRTEGFRWLLPGSKSMIETFWAASWFGGSGSNPSWAPGRKCWMTTKNVRVWTDKL